MTFMMGMAYFNDLWRMGLLFCLLIIEHLLAWRQDREMGEACRYPNLEFHTTTVSSLLYFFQVILALFHTVLFKSN